MILAFCMCKNVREMRIQFGTLLADIGFINLVADYQVNGKMKENLDGWLFGDSKPFNIYSNHSAVVKLRWTWLLVYPVSEAEPAIFDPCLYPVE
ncbi:hypothetical protein SLA2020_080470 [Shorea laevis]